MANETAEGKARRGRRWPQPPSVVISAGGPRWYCVQVHARAECLVVDALLVLGFQAVAPQVMDRLPANPVRKVPVREVLRPAFPGYVLAEFDASNPTWRRIASVQGVRSVMGASVERPSPLAAVNVAWVLGQFGPDGAQRQSLLARPVMAPLAVGCWVSIAGGPFEGMLGLVEASNGMFVGLRLASGHRVRMAQAAVEIAQSNA